MSFWTRGVNRPVGRPPWAIGHLEEKGGGYEAKSCSRAETARPCARQLAGVTFLLGANMKSLLLAFWADDAASDVPEYAVAVVVLTAILVVMRTLNIHGSDLLADMGIKTAGVAR
jgi:hypothetical protein